MDEEGRKLGQKDSMMEEEAGEMRCENDSTAISDFEVMECRWV